MTAGQAEHAGLGARHRLRHQAAKAAKEVGPRRDRFEALAAPEPARLKAELPGGPTPTRRDPGQPASTRHFELAHPEALYRLDLLDYQIAAAAWELGIERHGLDGIRPAPPRHHTRAMSGCRDVQGLDRGIDLGIGL